MNAAVLVERLREAESDGEIDLVVISSWVTDTAAEFIETVDRLHQRTVAGRTTHLTLNPVGGNDR
ncbi:hypothetical protein [Nitrosomonas sp.]|uniref:hypothetical protein n=1 Tax=Nitrosomonas sp. TaxID=42353 RepID=UPI0025E20408|nr:hypothetical protein [Nitrosomonas sp.]MBV6448550.1 hypothetical protein [Nitrosomonas sp.]